jgi:glutaredoxin-like YruB-family protein
VCLVEKRALIYTTPTCPYCRLVKEFLAQKGIPYREVNIAADREAREEFMRKGFRGVPVTVIGTEEITGFDVPRLERAIAGLQ